MKILNQTRIGEIAAVLLTGAGKFLLMDMLNLRLLYISMAIIGWGTYILYRRYRQHEILQYWGFTKENFSKTFKTLLPYVLICTLAFILYGYWNDSLIISWHFLPIILIYPIWGVIQQFLVVALIGGNLHELEKFPRNKWLIVVLTALIFGVVHFPFVTLVVGTFLLALVYTPIYLKNKNLWALGIYHGWLGAVFFFTVLERDPWVEIFEKIGI